MSKSLESQLNNYSKVSFQNDLVNLERDVKRQLFSSRPKQSSLKDFIEEWFGMPLSMSASAMVSMMILGIMLGTQLQTNYHPIPTDILGLDVFSVSNEKLPSSLLAAKL